MKPTQHKHLFSQQGRNINQQTDKREIKALIHTIDLVTTTAILSFAIVCCRLKLQHQDSSHLSFSTRGLPRQLQLYTMASSSQDSPVIVISWGFLNLSFEDDTQRVAFLSALRSLQLVAFSWDHSQLAWVPGSVKQLTGKWASQGVVMSDSGLDLCRWGPCPDQYSLCVNTVCHAHVTDVQNGQHGPCL